MLCPKFALLEHRISSSLFRVDFSAKFTISKHRMIMPIFECRILIFLVQNLHFLSVDFPFFGVHDSGRSGVYCI